MIRKLLSGGSLLTEEVRAHPRPRSDTGEFRWVQGNDPERSLLGERKVAHSFRHPGAVGSYVLALSSNFQSKDFLSQLKVKELLKNAPFCPPEYTYSHKAARGKGLST